LPTGCTRRPVIRGQAEIGTVASVTAAVEGRLAPLTASCPIVHSAPFGLSGHDPAQAVQGFQHRIVKQKLNMAVLRAG
jgi:hypothetical protein